MTPSAACRSCGAETPPHGRFCIACGRPVEAQSERSDAREEMNLAVLYGMAAALVLAVLFPPWESPPGEAPEFLGFHFILTGPGAAREGVISRFLWTIELITIASAGFYFSWLFRKQ